MLPAVAAAPPRTTTGDWAIWAFLMAVTALVVPGPGVLSIHTMEVVLMLKRLVALNVEGFPIMRHWYIVHRQGKRFSTIAHGFKEFVTTEAHSLLRLPSAEHAA